MMGKGMCRRAVLSLSLLAAVEGTTVNATWPVADVFPDKLNPTCTPNRGCQLGSTHAANLRSLCVASPGKPNYCWDVCNPAHAAEEYLETTNDIDFKNRLARDMVEEVRKGLNPAVSCPRSLQKYLKGVDACSPGDKCGESLRRQFHVAKGQGMCVVEPGNSRGRVCWSMCDTKKPATKYALGATADIAATVIQFRDSGSCNPSNWLTWVIALLVIALLTSLCVLGVFTYRKRRGDRSRKEESLADSLADDYEDDGPGVEERGFDGQEDFGAQGSAEQGEYGPPPPQSFSAQGRSFDRAGQHQDSPSRATGRGMQMDFLEPTHAPYNGLQQNTSMRIPGLDEPHLSLQSIQPMVVPQATSQAPLVQMGTTMPAQQVQYGSQPQYVPQQPGQPVYRTASAVPMQAFQTQLGPTFSTQVPQQSGYTSQAGSVQIGPGSAMVQPQAQYLRRG
mmetsp:Transcript_16135/g.25810  ORF Transcript_16135/g.25810 Transcript_16135/m.25810 type:complete len:449 (+) Transcript_16135:68-1414(+)